VRPLLNAASLRCPAGASSKYHYSVVPSRITRRFVSFYQLVLRSVNLIHSQDLSPLKKLRGQIGHGISGFSDTSTYLIINRPHAQMVSQPAGSMQRKVRRKSSMVLRTGLWQIVLSLFMRHALGVSSISRLFNTNGFPGSLASALLKCLRAFFKLPCK